VRTLAAPRHLAALAPSVAQNRLAAILWFSFFSSVFLVFPSDF
jgi:hypothetical protein